MSSPAKGNHKNEAPRTAASGKGEASDLGVSNSWALTFTVTQIHGVN